jgi:leader peptidase (prepilin peptidase)/N-methyltransferase
VTIRLATSLVLALAGLGAGWPQRAAVASLADRAPRSYPAARSAPATARDPDGASDRAGQAGRRPAPPPLALGLMTAALLELAGDRVHPWPALAATAWLIILAIPLSIIDIRAHRLPDALTGPGYVGVLAFLTVTAADSGQWDRLGRAALGGLIVAGACLLLAVLSRGRLGLGDCKAIAVTGTLLAWYGWDELLTGTLAGFALAGAYGIGLLAVRAATLRSYLPFGPFLLGGAILVVLLAA